MAKYIRVDRKKSGTYYWLVEARRENGKVIQKRLKYLGTSKPLPEYNLSIRHIDDSVVYSKGRPENLYFCYHYRNCVESGWHTEKLQPFYITHKSYHWYFRTRQRKLRKPRPVDWSSFDWKYLRRRLLKLVREDDILPGDMWFAKAPHWATAVAKVKRGQGVSLVPLVTMAIFEDAIAPKHTVVHWPY